MSAGTPGPRGGLAEPMVAAIRERTDVVPIAGIVLGSGLGGSIAVARQVAGSNEGLEVPYADIPGFPAPSVPGHAGRLWLGELGGRPVAIFQGRIHFYEGHGMPLASITSQIAAGLGAGAMLLTTAVGGIDPALRPGAIVIVRDHVNTMGVNPLIGWSMPDGSPAFVDVAGVYDPDLSSVALQAARADAEDRPGAAEPAEGVYAAVSGPSYETPAETAFLGLAGATVVGMSMIPEAVAARALGMRVLGLSFVTNTAGVATSHDDVLRAAEAAERAIGRILAAVVPSL